MRSFLITGSQNLTLSARATESLAGRAAVLGLLPLSDREALRSGYRCPGIGVRCRRARGLNGKGFGLLLRGGFRNWSPIRGATAGFGMRAMCRLILSVTSELSGRSAI